MNTRFLKLLAFAAAMAFCLATPGAAAQPGAAAGIRSIAAESLAATPTARPYDERDWLQRFYAPRAYAPAWSEHQANLALALLQGAAVHGLSPEEYGADALRTRLDSGDPRFDTTMTRAMLHYLADLRVGRVRSEYHTALPDPRLKQFDPVEQLRAALDGGGLAAAIQASEPAFPFYARVKDALAHYRQLADEPQQDILPSAKKIKAGEPYRGAAQLRVRLMLLGDLPTDAAPVPDKLYTPELAEGVRQFQLRHGLEEDGVLGKETMAALSVPLPRRVRQLELTLERLRWLPLFGPGRLIAVNLPAYRLWALQLGGPGQEAPLEMRVIVGTAVKTETPLFIGQMRYLEFNPYWNVPRSIALGEILPKLMRNRAWLAENDMELVAAEGGQQGSNAGDDALADLRAGKVRIRQRPGPQNALGAVKFAMPNPMNIYLHSTSQRELFARSRRDLSHGCIRVEKPLDLAHFVLGGQPGWTFDSIEMAMEPGPMRKVSLAAPVPVVLFYATAMVDREGRVLFSRDVYQRDPLLEAALQAHRE
ncbi:L,D-transpeptidase family protein [Massilia sp. RP-1-19]|uniref:L,D-transpeptidase family protein n=1 Tax=Massilia polaris TaxID=2728846 RepID=A0A848HEP1_9BURK|nr:L,D-transpeptidase family protein [Massilia polaris]NML59915.1 L,D-transpeptidase family protein [Massilia polaris]